MFTAELTRKQIIFLKCIFYFFKVRGIATLTLTTNKSSKTHQPLFTVSKWGILFNVLYIGFVLASNIFLGFYVYDTTNIHILNLIFKFDFVIDLVHSSLQCISAIAILTILCYRQSAFVIIANRIHEIVRCTATMTTKVSNIKTTFWKNLAVLFLVNMTSCILLITTTHVRFLIFAVFSMSFMMSYLVSNALMMQYVIILWTVKELFRMLNHTLMDTCRSSLSCSHVESHRTKSRQLDQVDYVKKLSDLHVLYSLLCKLCKDISELYSASMLICIVNAFWLLVFFGYSFMKSIVLENSKLFNFAYFKEFIYSSMSFGFLVVLTKAVNNVIKESKKTEKIVNDHLFFKACKNPDVTFKLKCFSNYLSRKNIRFSVYGLFSLDESLIMSIAGTITTYLVILLQFGEDNTVLIENSNDTRT